MATRAQRIRVGVFVVASATLLVLVIGVFGGVRFWRDQATYHVVYQRSVYGLLEGANVYFNGVRVGSVSSIDVAAGDPGAVAVTLSLEQDTPVRTDTRAVLVFAGITGLKEIDLVGGSPRAPRLPRGGRIQAGETTLDAIERRALALTERASQIIDNLLAITDREDYEALLASARVTADNLREASAALRGLIADNRAALGRSIRAIDEAARAATRVLEDQVEQLVARADSALRGVDGIIGDNRGELRATVRDLRQASRSFKELARELRQDPSRILRSRPPEERPLP